MSISRSLGLLVALSLSLAFAHTFIYTGKDGFDPDEATVGADYDYYVVRRILS